jgi:hypothetical protein
MPNGEYDMVKAEKGDLLQGQGYPTGSVEIKHSVHLQSYSGYRHDL